MLAHTPGNSNKHIVKETIQKNICVMYGKTIRETQSNIHKNQRNQMQIDENQRQTQKKKQHKINENQRKNN